MDDHVPAAFWELLFEFVFCQPVHRGLAVGEGEVYAKFPVFVAAAVVLVFFVAGVGFFVFLYDVVRFLAEQGRYFSLRKAGKEDFVGLELRGWLGCSSVDAR